MKYLFLHGLIAFPSDWDTVIARLHATGDHRLEAPAIPYFSSELVEPGDYADVLSAELPEGYIDDCIVVGHSFGCSISLCMLDRGARHAFLLAPHTRFKTRALPRREADMLNELDGLVYDSSKLSDEIRCSHVNLWKGILRSRKHIKQLKRLKAAMTHFDHHSRYARHAEKITFVLGRQDTLSPPEDFAQLRLLLRATGFYEIDACCHAIPLEHPAVIADLVLGESAPA